MNVKEVILLAVLAFSVISCIEEKDISQLVKIGQSKQEIKTAAWITKHLHQKGLYMNHPIDMRILRKSK